MQRRSLAAHFVRFRTVVMRDARVAALAFASLGGIAHAATTPQAISFAQPPAKTFGAAQFLVTATASSGLAVAVTTRTVSVCTVSAMSVTVIAAGTCTLRASQAGNATYAPAPAVDRSVSVAKANQAITFTPPASATYGGAALAIAATASSGLAVTLASATPAICTATSKVLTIVGAGNCVVHASQPGNANYNAAPAFDRTIRVAKASQTITFASLGGRTFGAAPFSASASATSKLPVTFVTATPMVCNVVGASVSLLATGTCTLRASQAGSANYNAAPSASQSFMVAKANQTITFNALTGKQLGDAPFVLAANTTSGLAVVFTSATASVCKVNGATLSLVAAGTCAIRASQAGNAGYAPAADVVRSFTVAKAVQVITFGAIGDHVFSDQPIALSATTSSGLPVSFASTTPTVCAVVSLMATIVNVGTCSIRAMQPGDASHSPAPMVDRSFAIGRASQSISFDPIPPRTFGDPPFAISATSTASLPIAVVSLNTAACDVTGNSVRVVAAGACALRASQAGDSHFMPAVSVDRSIAIAKAAQTIAFGALPSHPLNDPAFAIGAAASSHLPVQLTSTTSSICTVSGSMVSLVGAGQCRVDANQPGNADFNAAPAVAQTFTVVPATQSINFDAIAEQSLAASPVTAHAIATSGLPVTVVSATPVTCSIAGARVTLIAAGMCTLHATQPGNATYPAAAAVDRSFVIAAAAQRIVFPQIADRQLATVIAVATAVASSGLPVKYVTLSPGVCATDGSSSISLVAVGACRVRASQPGDARYAAAADVDRQFNVLAGTSRIVFNPMNAQTLAATPLSLSASTPSGLTIVFSAQPDVVCAVSGSVLTLRAPGVCSVTANESADGIHPQGNPVTQAFAVLRTPTFLPASTLTPGPWTFFVLPGRFHGGPAIDIAVPWQAGIALYGGNGTGAFAAAADTGTGVYPAFGAVGDFDNDGNLDFAISFIGNNVVGTYLGDGHDAFRQFMDGPPVIAAAGLVSGDIDGDGNADLVVAKTDSNGVNQQALVTLPGRGDGTFNPGYEMPVCNGPGHLVMADFNNDAVPDLALLCGRDDAIALILNRADHTIDFPPRIAGIPVPYRLAAADLNGDGNVDLVATSRYGMAIVLLNSGNGQFRNAGELWPGVGDVVIADFNGDGVNDVAIVDPLNDLLSVFAGAGDGTFAAAVQTRTGNYPAGPAAVDVDGNGSVDLVFANTQDGSISILRNATPVPVVAHAVAESQVTQAAPLGAAFPSPLSVRVTDSTGTPVTGAVVRFEVPVSGASAIFGNGARTIDVTTDADGIATTPRLRAGRHGGPYAAVARVGALSIEFNLTNQVAGTPPAFTSGMPPLGSVGKPYSFTIEASGSPSPQFSIASGALPTGLSLTPGGLLSGTPIAGGIYAGSFTASNGNQPQAMQAFSIVIATSAQTITFNSIADQPLDAHAVSAVAMASSGLAVVLQTLTPQICILGGSTVQMLHAGRCIVRATQVGNALFAPAIPVDRAFNVTQGTQTVKLIPPGDPHLFAGPAFVDTSASSGLAVTLSTSTASICVVTDNAHVGFIARGNCVLVASQAGSADYASAKTTVNVPVKGAPQRISFPMPYNGRFGEYTYLLATASSGLPVTLESLSTAVCKVVLGNVAGIGDDPSAPGNFCTIRAMQDGNATYDPAMAVDVTFAFGAAPNIPPLPPPTPHVVYATYLGGLGRDLTFDVVAAPDGGAFVGGTVGTTNFPGLSSRMFSNGGLDLVFVSKLQAERGAIDFSVAVGGIGASVAGAGSVPEVAAQQAMTIAPSGEVIIAARPGAADFPQRQGNYVHQGAFGLYKIDTTGLVRAFATLDPAIESVRALASDRSGAIYATGVANATLITSVGAAIGSSKVSGGAPYLAKVSPTGTPVFSTFLTVPNSRATAGSHDIGQGRNETATMPFALTVDGGGNTYVAGQATAADFPVTPGALDTKDKKNRDAFVVKVNASGTAIPVVARLGFLDVDRATGIAISPDGSIVVAGKTASVDDFDGGYAFQNSVHFSQNNQQTLRSDREFGFVTQLDPAASHIMFMAAIGSFGGDLIDHAFEPAPRPLKIAVDASGYIYAAGTGASDRTLPLMGVLPGMQDDGVFLMKISPNGGQRYSTFLGEGVATGVAIDGYGNAYVTGYSRGAMPTSSAAQAACTVDNLGNCVTPFVIKVNDAPSPVTLASTTSEIEDGMSITLSATVGDLRATGTIDFVEGDHALATVPVVAGGATFKLSPALGLHHYAATFHGGGYANNVSSPEVRLTVRQKASQ
ncbi:MAG: FG-GAP-like repeat-containing protein [Betaproteobacteria bacterium]